MSNSILSCVTVRPRIRSIGRSRYCEYQAVTCNAWQDKRGRLFWRLGITLDVWRCNMANAEADAMLASVKLNYPYFPGIRIGGAVKKEHLQAERPPAVNVDEQCSREF